MAHKLMFQEPSSISGNWFSSLMTRMEMVLKMVVVTKKASDYISF